MKYKIENMKCGGCVLSVSKVIQTVDAAAEINTNLKERSVEIVSQKAPELFVKALAEAEFPVS